MYKLMFLHLGIFFFNQIEIVVWILVAPFWLRSSAVSVLISFTVWLRSSVVSLAQVYLVARTATWEVLMGSAGPRPFTHCKKFVAATRIRTRDLAAGASLSAHSLATTLATDHPVNVVCHRYFNDGRVPGAEFLIRSTPCGLFHDRVLYWTFAIFERRFAWRVFVLGDPWTCCPITGPVSN